MTAAVLLALASFAAEPAEKSPIPDGRWSGSFRCRAPRSSSVRRATLDAADGKLLLRAISQRGVIIDEAALKLVPADSELAPDPRLPRRGRAKPSAVSFELSSGEDDPPLKGRGRLAKSSLKLELDDSAKAGLLGGACSGTLHLKEEGK